MRCYRRAPGYCYVAHQVVVHLRFFPHTIFANRNLHGVGILGEPEAVCMAAQEESVAELTLPASLEGGDILSVFNAPALTIIIFFAMHWCIFAPLNH